MSNSPLCVELQRAIETKSQVELIRAEIVLIDKPPWNPAILISADTFYETGMKLYNDEYFGDAAVNFDEAVYAYQSLIDEYGDVRADINRRANSALEEKRFEEAIKLYNELKQWEKRPEYDEAIKLAGLGEEDERLINEAREDFNEGNPDTAKNRLSQLSTMMFEKEKGELLADIATLEGYSELKLGRTTVAADFFRQALQMDPASSAAEQGLIDVRHELTNQQISLGYKQMDAGDTESAQKHFNEALAISPNSPSANEGLLQLRDIRKKSSLSVFTQQLKIAEEEQNWKVALDAISQLVLLGSENQQFALKQKRYESFYEYEEKLDFHLDNPSRFTSKNVRRDITDLVDSYDSLDQPGIKLEEKRQRLISLFSEATEKISIFLRSDGKTSVSIAPGKSLGTFKELEISVLPGDYRISGRQKGYREVVKKISAAAGGEPQVVEIVADRKF